MQRSEREGSRPRPQELVHAPSRERAAARPAEQRPKRLSAVYDTVFHEESLVRYKELA
jgi:hypothetical protein